VNILYLTEFLSAVGGGGEVAFANCIKEMGRKGHRVHVICHNSRDDQVDARRWANVKTVRIGNDLTIRHGWFPTTSQQVSYIVRLISEASKIIDQEMIDIIHANTLSPSIAGSILKLLYNIPVVSTVHHVEAIQYRRRIQTGLKGSFSSTLLRYIPRLLCEKFIFSLPLDYIHTVSLASAQDLVRFGCRTQIEVIPNALDLNEYPGNSAGSYLPYLLFIGRHVPQKNLVPTLDAFATVSRDLPHAKLVIVGDGPMRSIWMRYARALGLDENVVFTGYIDESCKLDLIRNCTALVFPGIIEGFGMAILEAFAMSKPVIASDIESVRELVRDGVDGFVVSAFSAREWETKMRLLLSSPLTTQKMGQEGKAKVIKHYDNTKTAQMFEDLYYRILSMKTVAA